MYSTFNQLQLLFGNCKSELEDDFLIKFKNEVLLEKVVRDLRSYLDSKVTKCIQKTYGNLKIIHPNRHLIALTL